MGEISEGKGMKNAMKRLEFTASSHKTPLYQTGEDRFAARGVASRPIRGVVVHSVVSKQREVDGLRVLIVEDHPEVARLFGVLLREHGATVHICNAGDKAVAEAPHFGPDVVLLDIRLPGMDGYQVARQFLSGLLTTRPLIIAITAYSQDRYRDRAEEAGIDLFLTKPVTGQELLRHIEDTPIRNNHGEPGHTGDA
jgi:CheY-like chemotaxis protein